MLNPKLIGCTECASIDTLIKEIDCLIALEGNKMYNNISFMLNRPIPAGMLLDLLNYRRILQYKYVNSDYISDFTVPMIANKVKRHTAGIKCNVCECNHSVPPIQGNTYTTTTTSTTTTSLVPTTTTTSSSTTTTSSTTSTTTTSTPVTTSTTTTATPDPQTYGLYYDNTAIIATPNVCPANPNLIYVTTNIAGQYIDGRDNILYGGNVEFYTAQGSVYWETLRNGFYVIFTVGGIEYGPYIYDIVTSLTHSNNCNTSTGQMWVDQSYVVYNPPSSINMFGALIFSKTPYIGTLDPNVLNIGPGDGIRIYKYDIHTNIL